MVAGKEIMGKSSDRVGGGDEVAGVLEAGVPFPPAHIKTISVSRKEKSRVSPVLKTEYPELNSLKRF